MLITDTIQHLRQQIYRWQQENKTVALVPTMGNLHAGHLALVREAQTRADKIVVSLFVNPLQFNNATDLACYPSTPQQDYELLGEQQVDLIFAPASDLIYPNGLERHTVVDVPELSNRLEGASRPGHFRGVATIVSKLFNLVQPDVACFGEKDYQQLAIIRQLTVDMGYHIDIIGVPIVRDSDGLALSSRNSRLSDAQRQLAPKLSEIMQIIAQRLTTTNEPVAGLIAAAVSQLQAYGFQPDGLAICDAETLHPLTDTSQRAVILMAAWLGQVRLIDNIVVALCDNPSAVD